MLDGLSDTISFDFFVTRILGIVVGLNIFQVGTKQTSPCIVELCITLSTIQILKDYVSSGTVVELKRYVMPVPTSLSQEPDTVSHEESEFMANLCC
jgi:hypothetical protein